MSKRWAFVIDGAKQILLSNSNDGVQALSLADRYIIISCDGSWSWQAVDLGRADPPSISEPNDESQEGTS